MAEANHAWDLDNSGRGPLRVPGFGGVPIDYQLPVDARFAHGIREWRQSPMITAQESAMVAVMDRLTDKPTWYVDVFDDAIVAQWRQELDRDHFIANPRLMRGKTWAWCVQELRDKAVYHKEHQHIQVLDTGSCVCKADSAELQSLTTLFQRAVAPLAHQYKVNQERKERRERLEKGQMNQSGQDEDPGADAGPDAGRQVQADDHEPTENGHTVNDEALAMEESEEGAQDEEDDEDEEASHMITDAHDASDNQQAVEDKRQAEEHSTTWHPNEVDDESDDDSSETRFMFDDEISDSTDMEENAGDNEEDDDIWWDWSRQTCPAHEGRVLDFAGSAHMISFFVDPLLFPLVYGRTLVLQQGGTVALGNMLASYRAAQKAPRQIPERTEEEFGRFSPWSRRYQRLPCEVAFVNNHGGHGHNNTDVKITSYINGLHPQHAEMYLAIEQVLSRTIQPWNDCLVRGHRGLHDESNLGQLGPIPARIITYGVEWENELPDWATAFRGPSESSKQSYHEEQQQLQRLPEGSKKRKREERNLRSRFRHVIGKEDWKLPPRDSVLWQRAREYLAQPEAQAESDGAARTDPVAAVPDDWDVGDERTWDLLCAKAGRLLCHKHPEPGTAFSYEAWKLGHHDSNKPIVDKAVPEPSRYANSFRRAPFAPPHRRYSVALQDRFRAQGLQVLVEISSIDLTPEMPAYAPDAAAQAAAYAARAAERFTKAMANNTPVNLDRKADGDGWQLPGQLNEHIVGAAMFAFDVDNVSEPRLAFRQKVSLDYTLHRFNEYFKPPENASTDYDPLIHGPAHLIGKDRDTEALAEILGVPDLQLSRETGAYRYQHLGSVAMRQGRLVAFPNVLEHRINPFRLVDGTRPGRLRWLTLYLVDPHYRVCSTRNVPPQQHDWWAEAVGRELAVGGGLPPEIISQIMRDTEGWPMGMDEAQWHREQLAREHSELRRSGGYGSGNVNWYCV